MKVRLGPWLRFAPWERVRRRLHLLLLQPPPAMHPDAHLLWPQPPLVQSSRPPHPEARLLPKLARALLVLSGSVGLKRFCTVALLGCTFLLFYVPKIDVFYSISANV